MSKRIITIDIASAISLMMTLSINAYELRWDWNKINHYDISFPGNFLWGCADSALQTEGLETANSSMVENSWTLFENEIAIPVERRAGKACHRWTKYEEDIQLIKNIGMNSHRFSIEWSKLEPEEGIYDHAAMQHYCDMIDQMLAQNITPMITLFHHTYPVWFAKKGAFEYKQNNFHFVRFALYVFRHLHRKVPLWITMNEPVGYAIEGYYRGVYPPGKKSLKLAGKVAKNLLNAHVSIYKEFKKIDRRPQIGLSHIFNPLDAHSKWNPLEQVAARSFDYLVNKVTVNFFQSGTFDWAYLVRGYNKDAKQALDFFGINYYTHTTIKQMNLLSLKPQHRFDEVLLDHAIDGRVCKVLYPEGLYRSIKNAAKLKVPLYITENGTAATDPALRDDYIKKHLYVISRALQEGFDVRGYFFWTLMDCFCWRKGFTDKHGIYQVNFETQERTLRPGCEYLIETARRFKNS
ncbi:MAG TPA: family 1 glycosylhydrolase [Candidatus Babeliales bacterium]|nr:family 1 glycosylhydrolase [Candidatus Babeliales bacterium]